LDKQFLLFRAEAPIANYLYLTEKYGENPEEAQWLKGNITIGYQKEAKNFPFVRRRYTLSSRKFPPGVAQEPLKLLKKLALVIYDRHPAGVTSWHDPCCGEAPNPSGKVCFSSPRKAKNGTRFP
jgi:hypothetical protein